MLTRVQEEFAERLLGQGLVNVFAARRREFDDDFWRDLMGSAHDHFRVLGVANHGYMRTEGSKEATRNALTTALKRGASVEFLWLDPESDVAKAREAEEGRATRRDIVDCMQWFDTWRQTLDRAEADRVALLTYDSIPSCGLTWADDELIVTHYIVGQNNLDSPGFVLSTSVMGLMRPFYLIRRSDGGRAELAQAYMNTYKEVRAMLRS